MKSISLSEFKKLKAGPCLSVTSDGVTIGILIVGAESDMYDRIMGIASQIDAGRGK